MLQKICFLSLIFVTYLSAKVNVAVAGNVSYAFNTLKSEFNKLYPNIKIIHTLASSGKLTALIKNGANYDIFMSANMKYPNALYKDGLSITKPIVYAKGSLALFSVNELKFSDGLKVLKQPSIKKIAIANPKTAPYGMASVEVLKNANICEDVKQKFVFGENISATLSYALKASDVGLVALSTLFSPHLKAYKKGVNWVEIDKNLYTPIKQGIILLKNSTNEAKVFYDFVLSKEAKNIFKSYGYVVDDTSKN